MHTIESMSAEFNVPVETVAAIIARYKNGGVVLGAYEHFKKDYEQRCLTSFTAALIIRGGISDIDKKGGFYDWCYKKTRDLNIPDVAPDKTIYSVMLRVSEAVDITARRKIAKAQIEQYRENIRQFIIANTPKQYPEHLSGTEMGTVFYLSAPDIDSQFKLERTTAQRFLLTLRGFECFKDLWTQWDGSFIYGLQNDKL